VNTARFSLVENNAPDAIMSLMGITTGIRIDRHWRELAAEIRETPGERIVYVIGAVNRGKTTFCRYLCKSLGGVEAVAYIDCDPGQSSVGPPATIGMQEKRGEDRGSVPDLLYFIGSTSPRGHLLPCLSGTKRLVEKAKARGDRIMVLDSSGFVLPDAAREFQFHVIDLIQPDFLVAFQVERELEGLLKNFTAHPRIGIRRMQVSQAVKPRTPIQRQRHRDALFRSYFSGAFLQKVRISDKGVRGIIPGIAGPGALRGLLTAVCSREHFLVSLGIAVSYDAHEQTVSILAPAFDHEEIAAVHFGSISLDISMRRQSRP